MNLVAEVAEEAPTVKGFVAILAEVVASRPQSEAQANCRKTFLKKSGLLMYSVCYVAGDSVPLSAEFAGNSLMLNNIHASSRYSPATRPLAD